MIEVIFYGATWCAPCQSTKPIVEPTVAKFGNQVKYTYKDVSASGSMLIEMGLLNARLSEYFKQPQGIPFLIIIDNTTSKELGRIEGGFGSAALEEKLKAALGTTTPTPPPTEPTTPTTPTPPATTTTNGDYTVTTGIEITPFSLGLFVLLGLGAVSLIKRMTEKPKKKK